MDKINKNAFIWIAIWGDSFGTAACSSFALLFRNLARVAAINLVGAYLMLLGKVIVAMATTGIAAIIFIGVEHYKTDLSSLAMPCAVVFLLSYLVSSLFMVVFETTIDTTFLCFLVDEEHNPNNMYASANLRQIVNSHSDKSMQMAERTKSMRSVQFGGNYNGPPANTQATQLA